jgi:hypothetical protein
MINNDDESGHSDVDEFAARATANRMLYERDEKRRMERQAAQEAIRKKRYNRFRAASSSSTPPATILSPAEKWVARHAIDISDDDGMDDDLVNPFASSSRKEAMDRLRSARGKSGKAKPRTKSRLKARAESSDDDDDDDDDDVFSGAAARGKKRRREFLALQLLQQFSNIRF